MNGVDAALQRFFAGEQRTLRLYRRNVASDAEKKAVLAGVLAKGKDAPEKVEMEDCFNLLSNGEKTDVAKASEVLRFLLRETFAAEDLGAESFLENAVEFGPRPTFASAWSSTCVSIAEACGVGGLARIEKSRRYAFSMPVSEDALDAVHDRMTECAYEHGVASFFSETILEKKKVGRVPTTTEGQEALMKANEDRGLGFDAHDVTYYTELFNGEKISRDPTDVELYDLSQSNSEHSRHWFFGGKQVVDGDEKSMSLFKLVKRPLSVLKDKGLDKVSLIAFSDNSSAIRGGPATRVIPARPDAPSAYVRTTIDRHAVLTAETHNFPCAVAPFPGAETGVGGRLRDVQATGRGAHPLGGIAGYCVGDFFPELKKKLSAEKDARQDSFEEVGEEYPSHMASPLQILIAASDGASDYGNKFGEPVIAGYCRSFRGRDATGSRCEWIKPVMFSAGVGWLDRTSSARKGDPDPGMQVAKIGGPAYKIGMGGGAASSRVSTAGTSKLDFDAVQRGDAQMCNRMNRVVRGCAELLETNPGHPIVSIHDQGCGGNGNVLKEIVDGSGALYHLSKFTLGDSSMGPLEIWGAEYQESNALLLEADRVDLVDKIAQRERCLLDVVGEVTNDGIVKVIDDRYNDKEEVVDLPLDVVLGKLPPKTFHSTTPVRDAAVCIPISTPSDSVRALYKRIVALPSVGSKRFLVHKADRSVTGLVARQQCVGPFQLPLSDCAVVARSPYSIKGTAVAVGEAPQCSALDPGAMARRATAEMLTNLCFALISHRRDIRLSGNWMWAAKLPGEGARMYAACAALSDALVEAEVAIDGGKDSLSMAAPDPSGDTVKAPGALTLTAYAPCEDIRVVATPDFKRSDSSLIFVDLSSKPSLGGTALAQVLDQVGDSVSDVDIANVASAFDVVQDLLKTSILAGHDRSDGGLLVALLEMAFAGDKGIDIALPAADDPWLSLFDEGPGIIIEVTDAETVLAAFEAKELKALKIGHPTKVKTATIRVDDVLIFDKIPTLELWHEWEATSFDLERQQRDLNCVDAEEASLALRSPPQYNFAHFFDKDSPIDVVTASVRPPPIPAQPEVEEEETNEPMKYNPATWAKRVPPPLKLPSRPKVAVLRCEGSNGDREMAVAFDAVGLEAWDVTMTDLAEGRITLDRFQGIVFVGGFSYADVCDSAKGWAAAIQFSDVVAPQFEQFRNRKEKIFSLGVCNGCQLMALLGWVPGGVSDLAKQPRFVHNKSRKFESRWSSVRVDASPSVLLKGMEGAVLGVWVAHGEGQAHFPDPDVKQTVLDQNLAPLRYADDSGKPTDVYPFCPNGSDAGIAGLCSPDGRHLAIMPHPERSVRSWHWPWMADDLATVCSQRSDTFAPWIRLFQNAATFLLDPPEGETF